MEVKEQRIPVQRTGVYFQAGDQESAMVHWFVCHGYGQLGENLIRRFDRLVERGHAVICAEGMNRFYWQGVGGQPSATWMTKRFRLDEIKDNNNFLSQIYDQQIKVGKKVLLGFSQGGTTMWRWIHEKRPDFDVFINYAGWMPEDIDLSSLKEYLMDKKLIFTYGSEDMYLTVDRIKAFQEVLDRSGLQVDILKTNVEHKVERDVLDQLCTQYLD
ncbi:MAG: hypothetical protein AAGA77_12255 [Bacteroidota bacterium]